MFGLNDNDSPKTDVSAAVPADNSTAAPDNPFSEGDAPVVSEPQDTVSATTAPDLHDEPSDVSSTAKPAADDNLLEIKQQALRSLQPLVSHLDQSPEEKFKTTMMLIQAADDSSLVGQAYEAANQIKDEKARAQALLDIVNEINYFSQHSDGSPAKA
jgi:hypothetical protein